jgi:hypothetical protein
MLLMALQWSLRGSSEAPHYARPKRPQPASPPKFTTPHTKTQTISPHSYQQSQTDARKAQPARATTTTTTKTTSEKEKPCRSKTASKPSPADLAPRFVASSPPPPPPRPESPLLLAPLHLSRRLHHKSRSPSQRPWHQLLPPRTACPWRFGSASSPPTLTTRCTPGSGTTGTTGSWCVSAPLRGCRSCRARDRRLPELASGVCLGLMTAPLGRFWSEGRETICCGTAAGECRLKTVVCAVERRWRLVREREAYNIQEFCRSARHA